MLSGTVELDRTFFNLSFKGSRHASEFKQLIEKYDKIKNLCSKYVCRWLLAERVDLQGKFQP